MSWVKRAYGCDCGCVDCHTCHPELQERVICECCGADVPLYEYDNGLCLECINQGKIQCEVCGKWFTDATGEDWAEENIVFCEACRSTPPPSPAVNFPQLCEVER